MFDDNIGKICQHAECNQKDYLNFYCSSCNKNYCKKHYHHDLSCPYVFTDHNLSKADPGWNKDSSIMTLNCYYCHLKIPEFSRLRCKFCLNDFCLKHRLEMDHKCPKILKGNRNSSVFSYFKQLFTNFLFSKKSG